MEILFVSMSSGGNTINLSLIHYAKHILVISFFLFIYSFVSPVSGAQTFEFHIVNIIYSDRLVIVLLYFLTLWLAVVVAYS